VHLLPYNKRFYIFLLTLLVIFIIGGCSSEDQDVESNPEGDLPTAAAQEVTPAGQGVDVISPIATSPLPTPTPENTPTPEVPTPENDQGTIVGILYDQATNQPYANQFIYLATIRELTSPDGNPAGQFAELDVTSDPFALTDESGRFVIQNVIPNENGYTLAVRLISLQELILFDTSTGNNILIEAEAGKIIDLGVLEISESP